MIFVTVGTDEHPFSRLLQEVESLVKNEIIEEEVIIQRGHTEFSSDVIKKIYSMLTFDEFVDYIKKARIVITHGGPGSIMLCLGFGKVPIVVPRQRGFREHVDDHQVKFTKFLEDRGKIIPVYHIEDLSSAIVSYERIIKEYKFNLSNFKERAKRFALKVDKICREVLHERRDKF